MTTRGTMTANRATLRNATRPDGEKPGMTTPQPNGPWPPARPATPLPAARPRRRWPWITGAVVLAAVLGAGAVLLLDRPSTPAPAAVATFTMSGELTVSNVVWDNSSGITPTPCAATGGYVDIVPGAAVTVANPQGQTVATGALQSGREGDGYTCQFPIVIPNVPDNLGSYSVTIGHRGTQVLDPATAHEAFELSLGGG